MTPEVVSERVLYPGLAGQKIAAFWDHRADNFEGCPFVVMAPKYGETKKNHLQFAYALAANGLNVVRFDHTSHVGESSGEKTAFTLPGGADDIRATFDFLESRFRVKSAALLASSLSARTAIRSAARDSRINLLLCVVGVVNVQYTLREVYREDLVANYLAGKRWGVTDILGHDIDFDQFLGAATKSDLHDLAGTCRDLAKIACPVVFFSGEDDPWVDFNEVRRALAATPRGELVVIPGAKHEVRENHQAAAITMREVVGRALCHVWGLERPPATLREPNQRALLAQNRRERERLRELFPRENTEDEFWTDYLRKYELLDRVDDYRAYLDLVGDLVGPFQTGELVLDVGCGNGLFGAWLLRRLAAGTGETNPAIYVGLDLTAAGLDDAQQRHGAILTNGRHPPAGAGSPAFRGVDMMYLRADLDSLGQKNQARGLPQFADGTFDAACCSLVLSYLEDPAATLAEMRRVLRPGGRVMVSSMKPNCDMSTIYRDFMDQHVSVDEVESARGLLRAAGRIKTREEQGHYTFYSGEELAAMVARAGFRDPQAFLSFGDQAAVVRAVA